MIVKFLVAFLLFFLFTPGVFLHLPQNGKVVIVALVHSILFTLIMWLLSNLMNIREGLTYEQWKENKEQIREYRKEQREKKWREDHPGFHVHHYRDRHHHHRHHAQKKTHANKAVAPAPAPIPTFPYELTFSTVSMGNCKGYSASYNNLSEYKEITGKTLSSTEGANVCVVILTTKNEYDYRSAVYNIENSLQTNHPIVFTLPSNYPQKPNQYKYADGQYTLTNIVKSDNPIIKKFTNNTTNTLLGVLSKTYPNVENGTNMKITFSLTTKPVVLAPSGATPVSHSPAIPTFPYKMTFSTVSMGNCKGYSVAYNNLSEYKEITGKTLSGSQGANVCVAILTTKNANDYRSLVSNLEKSLQTNHPTVFTLPSNYPQKPNQYKYADGQYTLTNIVKSDNPIIKKFTNNTTNTLLGVLSKNYPNVENGTNLDITFSLITKPVVLSPAPASPVKTVIMDLTLNVYCSSIANDNTRPQDVPIAPLTFSSTKLPNGVNDLYTMNMSFYPSISQNTYSSTRQNVVLQEKPMRLDEISVTNPYTNSAVQPNTPASDKPIAEFLTAFQCFGVKLPLVNNLYPLAKGPFIFTLTHSLTNKTYQFELTNKEYIQLGDSVNSSQNNNRASITLTEMGFGKTPSSSSSQKSNIPNKSPAPSAVKLTKEQILTIDSFSHVLKTVILGGYVNFNTTTIICTSNNSNDFDNITYRLGVILSNNRKLSFTFQDNTYNVNQMITDPTQISQYVTPTTNRFLLVVDGNYSETLTKNNVKLSFTMKKEASIAPSPKGADANMFKETIYQVGLGTIPQISTSASYFTLTMTSNSDVNSLVEKIQKPLGENKFLTMTLENDPTNYLINKVITDRTTVSYVKTPPTNTFVVVLNTIHPGFGGTGIKSNMDVTFTIGKTRPPAPAPAPPFVPAPAPSGQSFTPSYAPNGPLNPAPAPSGQSFTPSYAPSGQSYSPVIAPAPAYVNPNVFSDTVNTLMIGGDYTINGTYMSIVLFNMSTNSDAMNLAKKLQTPLSNNKTLSMTLPSSFSTYGGQTFELTSIITQQSIVESVATSSNSFIGVLDKQYSSQIPGQNVIVTFTIGKEKSVSPTSKQIISPAPAPAPVIIAKPPAPSGSYSITAKMVLIGGTYNYTNNQYVYPVAFYMNNESQQTALYTELQSRLQSGSLTFTLPTTFPFYKNQKLQISQLVPTTDSYYGSFAQGIPYGVVGLLNSEATNQQFEQTTNVVFD